MGDYWVDQGASAGIGFALGLLTPVVSRGISQGYHRVRASTELRPPDFREEDIQFFALNQWSPVRRLHRSHVQVEFDDRPWIQDWCDQGALDQIGRDVANRGGPSSTLRAMEVDHRESERARDLRLVFAPSEYGDLIAVQEYFRQDPDRLRTVIERLAAEDAPTMIGAAPPSVVAINMTVTSADHKLLAVRRSAAVQTSQNLWTLGPNETMLGVTGASGGVETVHSLAFRCLKEELELDEDRVDRLEISGIGYNVPAALVHIVGHARSTLRSSELEDNLRQSQGSFEVDAVAWLPATAKTVHSIIDDISRGGATTVAPSGKWLNSAGLAAADWWRWRRVVAP